MSDIHKQDFIKLVARRSGIPAYKIEAVMGAIVDEIAAQLSNETAVVWTGLGTFARRNVAERGGWNPATGERITIPPRQTVGCTIAETFKSRVTGKPTRYRRKIAPDIAAD